MRKVGVVVLLLAGAAMAQSPTLQPAGTTLQVMRTMIIPSSDMIFKLPRETPKDDQEWAVVQNNALILAESGNLLMMKGRSKDDAEWNKDAQLLVTAGAAAFKAAYARGTDKLLGIGDDIRTARETCHREYKPQWA